MPSNPILQNVRDIKKAVESRNKDALVNAIKNRPTRNTNSKKKKSKNKGPAFTSDPFETLKKNKQKNKNNKNKNKNKSNNQAPPGFTQPPAPNNTVFDIINNNGSNSAVDVARQAANDMGRVDTSSSNPDPYYTLITSKKSVQPDYVNPVTKNKIKDSGTVGKSWEKSKDAVDFAKNELAIKPFILGSAAAGVGAVAGPAAGVVAKAGTAGKVGAFVAGAAGSIVAPMAGREIHKQTKRVTNNDQFQKMNNPMFDAAVNWAKSERENEIAKSTTVLDDIGNWIPGLRHIMNNESITNNVKQYYLDRGYSNQQANNMAKLAGESYFAEGVFDVAGTVGIESAAEVMGQKLGSKLITKVGGFKASRVTKAAVGSLIPAGFFEGSAEYMKERLMNNQKVKWWETNQVGPVPLPGGLIGSGLFGSIFATMLGTTIARTSVTRPGTSKGLLTAARIIDPYEYPGDKVGGWIANMGRSPVLSFNLFSSNQTSNNQAGKGKGKGSSPSNNINNAESWFSTVYNPSNNPAINNILNPSNINNLNNYTSPAPSNNKTNTPNTSDTNNNGGRDPGPTENPGPNVPDTNTFIETYIDEPTEDPTEEPTEDPTEDPTENPSNVPTWASTPAPSPIMRVAPPLFPFAGGGPGSGGSGSAVETGKRYYDERKAAMKALRKVF